MGMITLVRNVPWHWRNCGEFFQFFALFARLGGDECAYLYDHRFLLYSANTIYYGSHDGKANVPAMGDKFNQPDMVGAVDALCTMIRYSDITMNPEEEEANDNPYRLGDLIQLSEAECRLISHRSFLTKIVLNQSPKPLRELICFLTWRSQQQTKFLEVFLQTGVNDAEHDQMPLWGELVVPFLTVEDEFQKHRIEYMLQSMAQIVEKFKKYPKFTRSILTLFWDCVEASPLGQQWVDANRLIMANIEQYMVNHRIRVPGVNAAPTATTPTTYGPAIGPRRNQ